MIDDGAEYRAMRCVARSLAEGQGFLRRMTLFPASSRLRLGPAGATNGPDMGAVANVTTTRPFVEDSNWRLPSPTAGAMDDKERRLLVENHSPAILREVLGRDGYLPISLSPINA